MMQKLFAGLSLIALANCAATPDIAPADPVAAEKAAYGATFLPSAWREDVAGPKTQVFVLASTHLSGLGEGFDRTLLEPLLARLAAFGPDIITHEGLSGEQCELVRINPDIYGSVFNDYCIDLTEAAASTGLDQPVARAAAEQMLADWPDVPSPAERRRLASLFVASGDRASAMVQWLQLPEAERIKGDGVDDWMLGVLNRTRKYSNESYDVAAVLAARLGLQRVYAVDDHTSDIVFGGTGEGFDAAILGMWEEARAADIPEMAALDALEKSITTGDDMLAYYRLMNTPATARAFVENDFHRALKLGGPDFFGRQYVAWYETRNLRMVSNIRAAMANHPGARVLNVVGASHKVHYEAYLDQLSDVQLVDPVNVLGE